MAGSQRRSKTTIRKVVYKHPYARTRVKVVCPEKEKVTQQSFADECDINNIVDMYTRTGMVTHLNPGNPQYGEAPDITMFEAALAQAEIRSAEAEGYEYSPEAPEAEEEPVTGSDTENAEKALQEAPEAPQEAAEG